MSIFRNLLGTTADLFELGASKDATPTVYFDRNTNRLRFRDSENTTPVSLLSLVTKYYQTIQNAVGTALTQRAILQAGTGLTATDDAVNGKTVVANASGVYGQDFVQQAVEADTSHTSSTFQDKLVYTTPAWTGTYRVGYYCAVLAGSTNKDVVARLYNSTDADEMCSETTRPSANGTYHHANGFKYVTFTGAAKTFRIQWANLDNNTQVNCRRARLEIWRVS